LRVCCSQRSRKLFCASDNQTGEGRGASQATDVHRCKDPECGRWSNANPISAVKRRERYPSQLCPSGARNRTEYICSILEEKQRFKRGWTSYVDCKHILCLLGPSSVITKLECISSVRPIFRPFTALLAACSHPNVNVRHLWREDRQTRRLTVPRRRRRGCLVDGLKLCCSQG